MESKSFFTKIWEFIAATWNLWVACIIGLLGVIVFASIQSPLFSLLSFLSGALMLYLSYGIEERRLISRIEELTLFKKEQKNSYEREIAIYLATIHELAGVIDQYEQDEVNKPIIKTAMMISYLPKLLGEKDERTEHLRNKLIEVQYLIEQLGGELYLETLSLLGQCAMIYLPPLSISEARTELSKFQFELEIIHDHQYIN